MNERIIIVALCMGTLLSGYACAGSSDLGVRDGYLSPCPDKPNCVSSQSTDPAHAVEPLTYTGTAVEAIADLKIILGQMKRVNIIKESPDYLHVTFTSFVFRFVDDVEFVIEEAAKVIHIRSASRTGYSDLGVNRKRVEKIRKLWEQRLLTLKHTTGLR